MKPVKAKRAPSQKGRGKSRRRARSSLALKRTSTISATQAARTFANLLDRIRDGGEAFVIERSGEPICEMSPVKPPRFTGADLSALLRSLPKPDAGFWDAVEEGARQQPAVPDSPWER